MHALGTQLEVRLMTRPAIDNTNANLETRESWVALAQKLKVPIRLVHFHSSPELCRHNNAVRAANKVMVSVPDLTH